MLVNLPKILMIIHSAVGCIAVCRYVAITCLAYIAPFPSKYKVCRKGFSKNISKTVPDRMYKWLECLLVNHLNLKHNFFQVFNIFSNDITTKPLKNA